jgi:hypothetical protein
VYRRLSPRAPATLAALGGALALALVPAVSHAADDGPGAARLTKDDLVRQGYNCAVVSTDFWECRKSGSVNYWCSDRGMSCTEAPFHEDPRRTTTTRAATTTLAVRVPAVTGRPAADAVAAIRALGLRTAQQTVVDRFCRRIGAVVSQTPAAGTSVPPGTTVTLTVGTRPPTPCP